VPLPTMLSRVVPFPLLNNYPLSVSLA
jgi:hypothetical protein